MGYTSATVSMWLAQRSSNTKLDLATFKTWADVIGTIITALAIIVGGTWAYFKFAKGRTFRPRIEIDMSGQWREVEGKKWLQARIRVKNIGASKIALEQKGTGLRVRVLAADQPPPPDAAVWITRKTCKIFVKHSWIEPGETISDDILLNLGVAPTPVLFEGRIIMPRKIARNISVNASQVIPADAAISDSKEARRISQWAPIIPGLQDEKKKRTLSGIVTSLIMYNKRRKIQKKQKNGSERKEKMTRIRSKGEA